MQKLTPTLTLLLACAAPLTAQITADIHVSQAGAPLGTITVELDHVAAPMATANFIGLASGKLSWIDSATGVVKHNTPYYDGIIFHRVIDGFMNQTGSQNGQGTDGPGYSFPDGVETNNGLDHAEAYKISMANSGPNTNGSQIFLTAVPTPWLDGKHIVFGEISATGTSRSIIDQINNTPTDSSDRPIDEVKIDSVTVEYNGVNFDPCAQGLPVVSTPILGSPVTPSTTSLSFTQPLGSEFHLAYSEDMVSWNQSATRSLFENDTPLTSFEMPLEATQNLRQFYSPALVTYSALPVPPASLANRTLTALTAVDANVPFTFTFDATGVTGTWSYPRTEDPLSGNITDSTYTRDHVGGQLIMNLSGINLPYWNLRRIGYDGASPTLFSGRHTGGAANSELNYFLGSSLAVDGTFTLTK